MINLSVNSRYYQQVETAERIIMTFQIMTDSTADLSPYYIKKHHLTVLGMTVTVGEETYETIGEAALDNSTLLAAIKKGATVHTSQINSGQFLEVFKKFASADEELLYLAFFVRTFWDLSISSDCSRYGFRRISFCKNHRC